MVGVAVACPVRGSRRQPADMAGARSHHGSTTWTQRSEAASRSTACRSGSRRCQVVAGVAGRRSMASFTRRANSGEHPALPVQDALSKCGHRAPRLRSCQKIRAPADEAWGAGIDKAMCPSSWRRAEVCHTCCLHDFFDWRVRQGLGRHRQHWGAGPGGGFRRGARHETPCCTDGARHSAGSQPARPNRASRPPS